MHVYTNLHTYAYLHRHEHTHVHAHRTRSCIFSCPVDEICQLLGGERRPQNSALMCSILWGQLCFQKRLTVVYQWSLTPCLSSEITSFHSASSSHWFWTTLGGLGLLWAPTQSLRPTKPHFVFIAHTTLGPKEGTPLGLTFSKSWSQDQSSGTSKGERPSRYMFSPFICWAHAAFIFSSFLFVKLFVPPMFPKLILTFWQVFNFTCPSRFSLFDNLFYTFIIPLENRIILPNVSIHSMPNYSDTGHWG